MGFGRRLFDLVRANVGHHLRRGLAERQGARDDATVDAEARAEAEAYAAGARARGTKPRQSARRASLERAYQALELPYGADADAVRRAHRQLLRRYHPDRFARDTERLDDATRLSQELTRARDEILQALAAHEI